MAAYHGVRWTPQAEHGTKLASCRPHPAQDDVLFSNLTVQETLEFAAAIRLPASVSAATKQQVGGSP